jgi:capsule polysaccharide export protein KpsE/RkpR
MPTETADARALLRVPPDEYVAERTRLAKQARADKDRALAGFYQSLKRPALSLWAVLAAGDDAEAVNELVSITSKLAETQASAGTAGAVSAATKDRRKAIERLVDHAVKALGATDKSAEARRAEIRDIVDQLSRHPELVESWVDGTLRDLPEEEFGFGAFNVVATPAPPQSKGKATKDKLSQPADEISERQASRAERAAKAEAARQARKEAGEAARELDAAERAVRAAETDVRKAEKRLTEAQEDRDAAERRHASALERISATT